MDPATATLLTTLGAQFLASVLSPSPPQLTQAQIAAILEQKRQQEAAATQRAWLIGGGLAAAALVAYLVISRK